jgi:hypothetical protein
MKIIKTIISLIVVFPFFVLAASISAGILFSIWFKYLFGAFLYILSMTLENDRLLEKSKEYTKVMDRFT